MTYYIGQERFKEEEICGKISENMDTKQIASDNVPMQVSMKSLDDQNNAFDQKNEIDKMVVSYKKLFELEQKIIDKSVNSQSK